MMKKRMVLLSLSLAALGWLQDAEETRRIMLLQEVQVNRMLQHLLEMQSKLISKIFGSGQIVKLKYSTR